MGTATHRQLWFKSRPLPPPVERPHPLAARMQEAVRERPLVALGVAVALGALAGSLVAQALSDDE